MAKRDPIQSVRGMRSIFPPEATGLFQLKCLIANVLQQFAFSPLELPLLEKTELFQRAVGEETDIVSKEMYTFDDRNGESLTLRPEGTAGVVRAMIENGLLQQPQRVFVEGAMFRYERPQKGRYRQFTQISVESFGTAGAAMDAELINIGDTLFRLLNIRDLVTLEINTIGTATERQSYRQALVTYLHNHLDGLDEDSKRRLTTNPLRILDSKDPTVQETLNAAPVLADFLGEESKTHFSRVCKILDALNIRYKINPRLVRGLDYYCHTVFEWTTTELGAQGTITAGGRYDGLVEQLGGIPTPAAGFAFGIDRIFLLAQTRGFFQESYPLAFCVAMGEENLPATMKLGQMLRKHLPEHSIFVQTDIRNLKKQFKKANQEKARFVLMIGDEEINNKTISVKNLLNGNDEVVAYSEIVDYLENHLESEQDD